MCAPFFAKWLFGLCFIHVVCVLCVVVEDIFWDCAYIYDNRVWCFLGWISALKICFTASFVNQRVR